MVCDADTCKKASDQLLMEHHIYVQSINYPTVAVKSERLRVTPTPFHTPQMMDYLVNSLINVWKDNGLAFREPYECEPILASKHQYEAPAVSQSVAVAS